MLEIRPNCEHCAVFLLPNSLDARICSFECTFCARCVDKVLGGICPNCGGNLVERPIRPARKWVKDNYLAKHPASSTLTKRAVNAETHAELRTKLQDIPPHLR